MGPPKNGLTLFASRYSQFAKSQLMQAAGMPEARWNKVQWRVTSAWLPCAFRFLGVKEKEGENRRVLPFWEDAELHRAVNGHFDGHQTAVILSAGGASPPQSKDLLLRRGVTGVTARTNLVPHSSVDARIPYVLRVHSGQ